MLSRDSSDCVLIAVVPGIDVLEVKQPLVVISAVLSYLLISQAPVVAGCLSVSGEVDEGYVWIRCLQRAHSVEVSLSILRRIGLLLSAPAPHGDVYAEGRNGVLHPLYPIERIPVVLRSRVGLTRTAVDRGHAVQNVERIGAGWETALFNCDGESRVFAFDNICTADELLPVGSMSVVKPRVPFDLLEPVWGDLACIEAIVIDDSAQQR